ncbi:hypothetical protein [Weissella hellenica]|uniref:Uncharacterized protein n=1 Tax=Weissella hellenica TaxID=46256 RepID=A0A4Y4G146_WEIHE|nr:hypothetical protein [Weissella hellenica]NKY67263.1 hypothetical protein [Weissella hellenica]GED36122.1 hypothetical protein WHE01_10260 [Weissella hellenica]SCB99611.1 hypothetical protein GA0061075_1106 [Weissella hellenica]
MSKLDYGVKKQVHFDSEADKQRAFDYLLDPNNTNIAFTHENNQNQNAWGPEDRIHFFSFTGVPNCLLDNMTAGVGNIAGRINCKELIDDLKIHGLLI